MTRREEIEQAAMQVGGVHPDWDALECFRVGYKEGAKWADKTMIEKFLYWLTIKSPFIDNKDMDKAIVELKKYLEE